MTHVTAQAETEVVLRVLEGLGVPSAEARIQATALVEADLRGHPSHGLLRLPTIAERIRSGVTVPGVEIETEWVSESGLRVDARRALGPVAAWQCVDLLCDRVGVTGVAVGAVRGSNHLGILAPYVEAAARRGFVALMTTTSEALVHPWNGARALVGTNPLALGVPTGEQPFVLDLATGVVSRGRILDHRLRGEPIPEHWALDADGRPTTDPAAAEAIAPFGGAKGYGLGLGLELLVAAMTGTALGTDVHGTLDTDQAPTKGDLMIVMDPERLGGDLSALPAYLAEIRASGVGDAEVLVPGDRSRRERDRRLAEGFEVADALWATLTAGEPA